MTKGLNRVYSAFMAEFREEGAGGTWDTGEMKRARTETSLCSFENRNPDARLGRKIRSLPSLSSHVLSSSVYSHCSAAQVWCWGSVPVLHSGFCKHLHPPDGVQVVGARAVLLSGEPQGVFL